MADDVDLDDASQVALYGHGPFVAVVEQGVRAERQGSAHIELSNDGPRHRLGSGSGLVVGQHELGSVREKLTGRELAAPQDKSRGELRIGARTIDPIPSQAAPDSLVITGPRQPLQGFGQIDPSAHPPDVELARDGATQGYVLTRQCR